MEPGAPSRPVLDWLGWTLSEAWPVLSVWQPRLESRLPDFRQRRAQSTVLLSEGWLAAAGKLNVRYCRLQSPKVDVATLNIFPTAAAQQLPIFASEWVVVGASCRRLVMDVEPAAPHLPVAKHLPGTFLGLGQHWQQIFPTDPDISDWFATIKQPWALHSACKLEQLDLLRQAYKDYLRTYIQFVQPLLPDCAAGPDATEVAAYKRHHAEHAPGRPMLAQVFGYEWAERFFFDAHFAILETAHQPQLASSLPC